MVDVSKPIKVQVSKEKEGKDTLILNRFKSTKRKALDPKKESIPILPEKSAIPTTLKT